MSRTVAVMMVLGCLTVSVLLTTPPAFAFGGDSVCSDVAGTANRLLCKLYCDLLDCDKGALPRWKERVCQKWG